MFYSIREGFAGLYRAKFSTIVTISVIVLSLLVIGIFLIFALNTKRIVDSIRNRIELELFIDNSYDSLKIDILKQQILSFNGIDKIKFISKEEAAEVFKKQFDQNIFEILDENPLPSSFQITLTNDYRTSQKADQLVKQLTELEGVDDIVFRQDILVTLENYMDIIFLIVMSTGGLLAVGSIFLISNTIKLTILSRIHIIETMKLVGATKGFIRRPFIFEGFIQGFFGSFFATLILFVFLKAIRIEVTNLLIIDKIIFLIIIILGVFLGLLGSILAIQRFLKY